jgi:amidase
MVITELSANELSKVIHAKQVSCREVMQAYLQRIESINPHFNALVSLQDPASLLAHADVCDTELSQGHSAVGCMVFPSP